MTHYNPYVNTVASVQNFYSKSKSVGHQKLNSLTQDVYRKYYDFKSDFIVVFLIGTVEILAETTKYCMLLYFKKHISEFLK